MYTRSSKTVIALKQLISQEKGVSSTRSMPTIIVTTNRESPSTFLAKMIRKLLFSIAMETNYFSIITSRVASGIASVRYDSNSC